MAKTTATIFGLVLAAVSIGVNITRYPIVWQMADPRLAAASTDSPASEASSGEQPASEARPESLPNPPSPAPPAEQYAAARPIAADEPGPPREEPADLAKADESGLAKGGPATPADERKETPLAAMAESGLAMGGAEAPADDREETPPVASDPLVPVNFAGASRADAPAVGGRAVVRRLPPVTTTGAAANVNSFAALFDGSAPAYPSTGIE